MSLYHKYRPKALESLRGNTELKSSLGKMLSVPETMPHCYLLHGQTGCGKTTVGRIIKNILEVADCDFREYNSADKRGIDEVRQIIKDSQYKPLQSMYTIYLIDECHKLTGDAQNAFLKILEDTPKHVIFILCTTEPEKLIKAIKNRCQQFQLKPLEDSEMKSLLKKVARKEGGKIDSEILDQIVKDSNGQSRDALQILEQVLNTEPNKQLEVAKQTAIVSSLSIDLCRALLTSTGWKKIAGILTGLKGQEAESIRRHVLGYAQAILLKEDNVKAGLVMEEFIEPFYHTGFPQLVFACYTVVKNS